MGNVTSNLAIALALAVPLVAGCPGSSNPTEALDLALPSDAWLSFRDGGPMPDGPRGDAVGDSFAADDNALSAPDVVPPGCTAKTPDGIYLNPGCDPDVQVNGITAVDIVTLNDVTTWIVVSGKKWWNFDMSVGAFTNAGPDFSAWLSSLQPDCTATTSDGIPLNPGCDLDVQVNGITAIGNMTFSGQTRWFVTSGKKWWSYDLSTGAFIDGGKDFATQMRSFPPDCSQKTADGLTVNSGCDADVQTKGLTSVDIVTINGQTSWLVTCGAKWWSFDTTAAAFTQGGKDFSAWLKGLQPDCTATTNDGIALNPGCDPDVQVNGISALGNMTFNGQTSWAAYAKKKWWTFDHASGAFTDGGKDIAAFCRMLPPN